MARLFPIRHVIGYIFSLILSVVGLGVVFWDFNPTAGLWILIVCALIQASLQLVLFMHIGETDNKKTLYFNIAYALFVGLVTIFGTLFTMLWGW
ncbi:MULTISPECIES: cytochrome aa3 quinol oxidase subunit IV [Paenibacillus]|uniref:cytochrome aa3 quinol oxidase subunit IV n=1 Tax=Paenibacillus TaxID=44249 RepID=UPI000B98C617|nr:MULTISPECIES: cytochrome aa3 quinol oxidase subunit IV [Paenibacillus]MBJ9991301.1 cytochrome aa3 quinol oxidase subunit IV [Paenibacillus sp. S28]MEC0175723.1 cytochrome aa3 quinol oxidase subunit IV [Paenibacillus favisporus]OZB90853.1 cytochrome aa3 quinol oxidase subunit IV [Paenibacillus sp. XY044]PQP87109.1 cytochrome aa3 quinol oxidase subunit IV [Paenibacillus sp. AR247]